MGVRFLESTFNVCDLAGDRNDRNYFMVKEAKKRCKDCRLFVVDHHRNGRIYGYCKRKAARNEKPNKTGARIACKMIEE